MKLMKGSLLSFSVISLWTLTACGSSNAVDKQASSSTVTEQSSRAEQQTTVLENNSKIQAALDKAKKDGKAVFVVVTGTGVTETDKAATIAKEANAIYKNAIVVQMDRDDTTNAQKVAEWRLSGAPLPLLLVVSPKGLLTGGRILSQATAENIAALVPSPKMEDVYTAIGASKPVLVVFTKKTLSDRAEVLKVCQNALTKLDNKAVVIEVDMDDSKETNFMNQFQIDKASIASTTLVINAQGQVAGTSTTVPDASKLVAAATAPVKSGCGPGCGPAGCGK